MGGCRVYLGICEVFFLFFFQSLWSDWKKIKKKIFVNKSTLMNVTIVCTCEISHWMSLLARIRCLYILWSYCNCVFSEFSKSYILQVISKRQQGEHWTRSQASWRSMARREQQFLAIALAFFFVLRSGCLNRNSRFLFFFFFLKK